jgi:hypothetical protein
MKGKWDSEMTKTEQTHCGILLITTLIFDFLKKTNNM